MEITSNPMTVDSSGRELVSHGTTAFPVACYHDDLSRNAVPWHWHEEWEVTVVTEGSALIAAGNQKLELQAGEGVFVNSQILHGCWGLDGETGRFHSVVFHPRLVGGSLDSVFFQSYIQPLVQNRALESLRLTPSVPWQREALTAVEKAWRACEEEKAGFEFRAREHLSELTFLLQSHVPAVQKDPAPKTLRDAERIKIMLQYIHDHAADAVTIGEIAESAAVSESECLRCFRSTIGTTPIQYVRQYRIRQAVQLIGGTQLPISLIAEQCGFQDVSYFTKTFHRMMGCAPLAYRRQQQNPSLAFKAE